MQLSPLYYIYVGSNLLPVAFGFPRLKKLERPAKLVMLLVGAGFIAEVMEFYCATHNIHNLWLLHIFTLFEYVCLMLIFAGWQERKRLRRYYYYSIPLFVAVWVVMKLTIEPIDSPHEYVHELSGTMLSIAALFEIVKFVTNDAVVSFRDIRFCVALAVLVYFVGNVFLFMELYKIVLLPVRDAMPIWTINWLMNIAANILFSLGILWSRSR
jgi:hypothetical protein